MRRDRRLTDPSGEAAPSPGACARHRTRL